MDSLLYTAAAGARDIMLTQAVLTNNLANASTPGFRKDLETTESSYLQGPGLQSRVFAGERQHTFDSSDGRMLPTGNSLDIAINGDGWIAVLGEDGAEALTRRGDLKINALGQLINGAGNPILGDGGPIAIPPAREVTVGSDGTVSILPLDSDDQIMSAIDRIKLVNPSDVGLYKGGDGLIRSSGQVEFEADAEVTLVSGSLEASNVNPIEMMVSMIELSRRLESHVKIIETMEQLDQSSAQLMRVN